MLQRGLRCLYLLAPVIASGFQAEDKLEHAREVNLRYAAGLPNFVADETAKRYTSTKKSPSWRPVDTIETEITIKGNRAVRKQIRRNGEAWERPFEELPGFKWSGGFGTEIRPLFDPQCPTTIEYQGQRESHGQQLREYRFSSPADGCFANFYIEDQKFNPARSGRALVADPAGNLMEFEENASGFPSDFKFAERRERVSWDYVRIGDASHLLPVSATFTVLYSNGIRYRVEVQFRNHRHFEASTDVTFH
jgi:hypothetical protein